MVATGGGRPRTLVATGGGRPRTPVVAGEPRAGAAISMGTWLSIGEAILV